MQAKKEIINCQHNTDFKCILKLTDDEWFNNMNICKHDCLVYPIICHYFQNERRLNDKIKLLEKDVKIAELENKLLKRELPKHKLREFFNFKNEND